MKKLIFSALAIIGLLAVSCNKEKEAPVLRTDEPVNTHTVSIKATIAEGTRTSYTDDKTFAWKENDSITVVTLSPDEDYIRLCTFYAQSAGPETIFSGEVEEGYTLYSMAFYSAAGSSVFFGDDGNIYFYLPTWTVIDGDSKTEYTVESSNPLANLPLIGVQMDEENTYQFYTATGAAKFTVTDVPEGAAYLVLEMSDVPLSGQFTWDDQGIITNDSAREGRYTYTGTDGNTYTAYYAPRYVIYEFERNADGTVTVYMPLPVGKIPAGTTLSFYDEDLETALYTRTIPTDIPINRNQVTDVASFSATCDWESIGYGYYFDYPTFYYMTDDADKENDDIVLAMASVEFFKDKNRPGVYRIENPYPIAAEKRGYTIKSDYALDEYLTFTVLKDNTVNYDLIYTGYEVSNSAETNQAFLACPGMFGEDNSFNFVPKYQADGTPQQIFLSAYYLFGDSYYYWLNSGTTHWMLTYIFFPGVEDQLDMSFDVALKGLVDNTPAQPVAKASLTIGDDIPAADLIIAQDAEEAEQLIADGKALRVTTGGEYNVNFAPDAPTGTYRAFAKLVMPDDFTQASNLLLASEEEMDYFRTDEDRKLTYDDILGNYTANAQYYINRWYNATDFTMTVEESDDVLSGDIMFTNFCPEYAKAAVKTGTVTYLPVYGWFDTATGVVTVPTGQAVYSVKSAMGGGSTTYTIEDYDDAENLTFYLKDTGVLYTKKYIVFMKGTSFVGVIDEQTTFNRSDVTPAAPARKARRQGTAVTTDDLRLSRVQSVADQAIGFKGRIDRPVK